MKIGKKEAGGRNNLGHITVRHLGGGTYHKIRLIDYQRVSYPYGQQVVKVLTLEMNPGGSGHLALVEDVFRRTYYILAPRGIQSGQIILMTRKELDKTKLWVGCSYLLGNLPLGSLVSNIELTPGLGGQLARAAGTCWQVSQIKTGEVILRSYGGGKHKVIKVSELCMATLGQISNVNHKLIVLGKAGAARWAGRRPKVRGKAQNPVDHPLGGSTRGGKYIKNVWGRLVK